MYRIRPETVAGALSKYSGSAAGGTRTDGRAGRPILQRKSLIQVSSAFLACSRSIPYVAETSRHNGGRSWSHTTSLSSAAVLVDALQPSPPAARRFRSACSRLRDGWEASIRHKV